MFEIPYTEMLISFACNLHCDGCQNYTNYGLTGNVDLAQGLADLRGWSARIRPEKFRLLGGEPLIHPDLPEFIRTIAECWPSAKRAVVTNGMLIDRREDIADSLAQTGTTVELSIHSNDPKYLDRLRPNIGALKRWVARGIQVTLGDSRNFFRTYRGIGKYMRPHNHDPAKSWAICNARTCINIYQSRLWKCPTISMLAKPLEKFGLLDHVDWAPYLKYQGLSMDSSDEDLRSFLSRGPEEICSLCPAKCETYQKDVFNLDFERRDERAEVNFPVVDFAKFIQEC